MCNHLITKLPNDINFVWIPSHIGIPGNEVADRLARDGAKHDDVDYSVTLEQGDVSRLVSAYICEKWQNSWNSIEPYVSTRVKFVHNNRKKEISLTRLRIGKCCLNSCLHEINAHPVIPILDSVIHVMNQKQLNTICSIVKML